MKKRLATSQIMNGAAISYASIIIGIGCALIYTPWMKNKIGDANYGLYSLVTTLISIFLMDFGLSSSVNRFVAKYRAEKNEKKVEDVLGYIFKLYIALDIVIAFFLLIVFFFIDKIYVGLSAAEIGTLKSVYIVVGTYSIAAFPFMPLSGILGAYEHFVELKLLDLCNKLLSVFLIVMALLLNGNIISLVVANAIAGMVVIALKLYVVHRRIGIKPNYSVKNPELLKQLFSFSIWVTVLSFGQRLVFNITPSILGITANSIEIARFAPASQLEGYFFTFAYAINGLFLPTVARYDAKTDSDSILKLAKKVGKYQISVLGLLYVGIAVVGSKFMHLWMGVEYEIAGLCTLLMVTPNLIQYPQQIFNTLLTVRGLVKYQAIAAVTMGIVNLVFSFFLSPRFGVVGASVSILIAACVNLLLLNIVYRRKLNIRLRGFYKSVYARSILSIMVSILISVLLIRQFNFQGWSGFTVDAVMVATIYAVCTFGISLTGDERKAVIRKVKLKLGKTV